MNGISASEVLESEVQDVYAQMGLHRHPDHWKSDAELAPTAQSPAGKGRQQVSSPRDRDAEADATIAEAHARNAARMAAAREGRAQPRWADVGPDPNTIDLALRVGVGGGGQ